MRRLGMVQGLDNKSMAMAGNLTAFSFGGRLNSGPCDWTWSEQAVLSPSKIGPYAFCASQLPLSTGSHSTVKNKNYWTVPRKSRHQTKHHVFVPLIYLFK